MIVSLTDDSRQVEKLRRKLKEYQERTRFTAPEVVPIATYKTAVLAQLLKAGQVDEDELRTRFKKDDWYDPGALYEAVRIVAAYNSNETCLLRGGTGLK